MEPAAPVVVAETVLKVNSPITEEVTETEPVVEEVREEIAVDTATPTMMSESHVILVMQKSIKACELRGFNYDDVQALVQAGEEEFEGVHYQTGLATVNMTTIFGLKEQKVKALCSNGKVAKWLWAVSGVEVQ
ncbi:hypothetical protein BSZ32_13025 [Rubritalea profundi]|uniref:Uncharacterized protein n=1 Tax=Rubritalea profundi TaxID=1658618 RepID=A0A2S7U2V8_9BACT|nr:hypothetical protein BSZ32_13025 [Rubritalea profundi]